MRIAVGCPPAIDGDMGLMDLFKWASAKIIALEPRSVVTVKPIIDHVWADRPDGRGADDQAQYEEWCENYIHNFGLLSARTLALADAPVTPEARRRFLVAPGILPIFYDADLILFLEEASDEITVDDWGFLNRAQAAPRKPIHDLIEALRKRPKIS